MDLASSLQLSHNSSVASRSRNSLGGGKAKSRAGRSYRPPRPSSLPFAPGDESFVRSSVNVGSDHSVSEASVYRSRFQRVDQSAAESPISASEQEAGHGFP